MSATFRFRTYLRPMEQDTVMHQYKSGASFDKAVSLYLFDTRLRMLVFSAIQQIEVSLRAKIINHFSLSHGAFWFIQPELATDKHKFTENLKYTGERTPTLQRRVYQGALCQIRQRRLSSRHGKYWSWPHLAA
ncbi:Abi family protein [Phocaeicola vulgatus]|nr:Abi family protein [Phocaeicola vulgatus]